MLKIKEQIDLAPYTTLKVSAQAAYFAVIKNKAELNQALIFAKKKSIPMFVLGGGSNLLISRPLKALVLKNEIKGFKLIKETKKSVWLEAAAGELWTTFVDFAIKHSWGGLENLYYIPGTVGAAPVQNIGAYGVELKDVFDSLQALDLKSGQIRKFKRADCRFAYRDSIFKRQLKGRYFIISLIVKLSKKPQLNLNYGEIKAKLSEQGIDKPTIKHLAEIIRQLRESKLPNPAVLANAGSFFKNPEISQAIFKKLQIRFPEIKHFPASKPNLIKIPAGWLIEQVGFKGKRFGPVAMYDKQALVLVNYGGASARQILNHIKRVQTAVFKKFGLQLELEVNIV